MWSASRIKDGEPSFEFSRLGLRGLELFAMYATAGQTDRRTDEQKQSLLPVSVQEQKKARPIKMIGAEWLILIW